MASKASIGLSSKDASTKEFKVATDIEAGIPPESMRRLKSQGKLNVAMHNKAVEYTMDPEERKKKRIEVLNWLNGDAKSVKSLEQMDDIQIAQLVDALEDDDIPLVIGRNKSITAARDKLLLSNMSFHNIGYRKDGITYLSGVTGFVKQNSMVCVLGAPDAGVTTLLKVLSGRASRNALKTGQVLLDGLDVNYKDGFHQHVGFVTKDDIHYATLTVKETLRLSVRMRYGYIPDFYQKFFVQVIIKYLGLNGKTENTIIGDATRRGISGGQKRRVTIAAEIVAGHNIILADLLTNGLDSKTAFDIVNRMRIVTRIKQEKQAFMISLVQPAPELFNLFDYLLLMSKGRTMFFGPLMHNGKYVVLDYLFSHDFFKPKGKSVPDFLAEISANPVKYHRTRLRRSLWPKKSDTKQDTKTDIKEDLKSEESSKLLAAKEIKQDTNPLLMNVSETERRVIFELKKALDDTAYDTKRKVERIDEVALVVERPSVGESAAPLTSSIKEVKTIGSLPDLKIGHTSSDKTTIHGVGLPEKKGYKGISASGRDVTCYDVDDNEESIGYALLLKTYRASKWYADLGKEMWQNFTPTLPWEKTAAVAPRFSTPLWYQTFECLKREWIVTIRDRDTIIGNIAQMALIAFILGTVFLQMGDKQTDADARAGYLFTIMLQMIFHTTVVVPEFMEKKRVYIDQEAAGYYHGSAFFLATQIIKIPFNLLNLFVFLIILYPLSDLAGPTGGEEFWYMFGIIFLMICVADGIVVTVCGVSPNEVAAQALTPVIFVILMIMCGYLVYSDDIPVYWEWLHIISFMTYGYRGLMLNEFKDLKLGCDSDELAPPSDDPLFPLSPPNGFNSVQVCPFTSGEAYLSRYDLDGFDDNETNRLLWYMAGFALLTNLLGYIAIVVLPHEAGDQEEPPEEFDIANKSTRRGVQEDNVELERKPTTVSVIEWNNLTYTVPDRSDKTKDITLLNKVYGYAKPGEMVALMGPSGAGKSTLLDVIAQKKSTGEWKGDLLINGNPPDEFYPRIAGYVEQFDSLVELSTVEESVMFSAMLRLEEKDEEVIKKSVHTAMKNVGIDHVKDQIIGNIETGGISPELRKKTAIAVELVMRPTILFLDEPTTGLDAVSALAVIDTTKALADLGLAVICTIHQPSSELFSRFQRILILQPVREGPERGGCVSYFGDVNNVEPYCEKNKLGKLQEGRNIADFALEALGDVHANEDGKEVSPCEVFTTTPEYKVAAEALEKKVFETLVKEAKDEGKTIRVPEYESIYAKGAIEQFHIVLVRSIQNTLRDTDTIVSQMVSIVIMGVIIGSLYWQMETNQNGAFYRVAVMFLALVFICFTSSYKVNILINARASFYRETTARMYRGWVFYVTQMISDALTFIPRALLFTFIVYFMTGLSLEDGGARFWYFMFMVILTFYQGLTLAETMAFSLPNINLAQGIFTLSLTIQTLFCGFLVKEETIPDYWSFLYYINMFRYPLAFFCKNELEGLELTCDNNEQFPIGPLQASYVDNGNTIICDASQLGNLNCFRPFCQFTKGDQILEEFSMTDDLGFYAGITILFIGALRVINVLCFTFINFVQK
mmetsp:Transcript_1025/g.1449  ORF Transcript_1025/g.1449 Transcript_1025/m.1449 type:complete len:1574 (-) Transcript_1025:154-4875(-)